MIRLAKKIDIDLIMGIVQIVVKEMNDAGNDQWNEVYPKADDFLKDIENETLYVHENEEGNLLGFICLDDNEPVAYEGAKWTSRKEALIIHRMAVSNEARGLGVARALMKYAETLASEKNIEYIHSDTYSKNIPMNGLFKKMGYTFTGSISMKGKPFEFNCYEKKLNESK